MTPLALLFMVLSWSFVLGLAGWCFHRVLRAKAPGKPAAEDEQEPPQPPVGTML